MPIERCTTIRPETHRTAIEIVTATWSIFQVINSMAYQEDLESRRHQSLPQLSTGFDSPPFDDQTPNSGRLGFSRHSARFLTASSRPNE